MDCCADFGELSVIRLTDGGSAQATHGQRLKTPGMIFGAPMTSQSWRAGGGGLLLPRRPAMSWLVGRVDTVGYAVFQT
jgi:hypothetical protein